MKVVMFDEASRKSVCTMHFIVFTLWKLCRTLAFCLSCCELALLGVFCLMKEEAAVSENKWAGRWKEERSNAEQKELSPRCIEKYCMNGLNTVFQYLYIPVCTCVAITIYILIVIWESLHIFIECVDFPANLSVSLFSCYSPVLRHSSWSLHRVSASWFNLEESGKTPIYGVKVGRKLEYTENHQTVFSI